MDQPSKMFERPSISQLLPRGREDAFAGILAIGINSLQSEGLRELLLQEDLRQFPAAQGMAVIVAGMMLKFDEMVAEANGRIPVDFIMPMGLEFLSEAAEVLMQGGRRVTIEDWRDAAQFLFVLLARKMGAEDDEIMATTRKLVADHQRAGAAALGVDVCPADLTIH